jgi:hypothetical protein
MARILFWLNICSHSLHVTSSLARGWVCCLQLLLALASPFILRSKSCRTQNHILLSQIWGSPNLEAKSPYLYPPGTGWPNYNPRHWSLSVAFYDSQGYSEGDLNPPPHPWGQSAMPWCINSGWTEYKTPPPTVSPLFAFLFIDVEAWTGRVESHVTSDGQLARPLRNKAPIWSPRRDFHHYQTVAGTQIQCAPPTNERMGLPPTTASFPRKRSHSRVQVPQDTQPHSTISDSRLPPLSPHTTRRAAVEVLNSASTWD